MQYRSDLLNSASLSRRETLRLWAAAVASSGLLGTTTGLAQSPSKPTLRSDMGLVIYCQRFRRELLQKRGEGDLYDPLQFLRHCQQIGAGGMQSKLGVLSSERIDTIRDYMEQHDLFVDAIINPPADEADVERFTAEVQTAAAVGVQAARTVIMPGRRYERFSSLEEAREFGKRGKRMLQRAIPVVEKHRVPLAVENHKDQRIEERVDLLRQLDSEYVGACVDTGNSFALLDDPYDAVAALAPYAFTVHLKDQAIRSYADGFLLGDVPLGQGCFDLQRMVAAIKEARPNIRFTLELITRDALKVPCLTEDYWSTLPDVPASDLARALRMVRSCDADVPMHVSSLPLTKQVELEEANVKASLRYAQAELTI